MIRHRKLILSTLAAAFGIGALGAALPALAQPSGRQGGMQIFRQADADNDGRVTQEEAWNALSARFAQADANRDGGVTWEEFRAYARTQVPERHRGNAERQQRMETRGQSMFRALDADRDGRVTQAELRPAAEAMFRARDRNGDGALERDELRPRHARADRQGADRQGTDRGNRPAPAPAQAPTQAQ